MTNGFSIIRSALFFFALLLLPSVVQAQKFVHAYSSISALNATFWIVQDAGFAKQEGLDTELVYIPSSGTVAQATSFHLPTVKSSPTSAYRAATSSPWAASPTWWRFISW